MRLRGQERRDAPTAIDHRTRSQGIEDERARITRERVSSIRARLSSSNTEPFATGHRIDNVLERLNDIHSALASDPPSSTTPQDRSAPIPSPPVANEGNLIAVDAPSQLRGPIQATSVSPHAEDINVKAETRTSAELPPSTVAAEARIDRSPPHTHTDSAPNSTSPPTSTATSTFSSTTIRPDATGASSLSGGRALGDVQREPQELRQRMSELAEREGFLMKQLESLRGSCALDPQAASQDEQGDQAVDATSESISTEAQTTQAASDSEVESESPRASTAPPPNPLTRTLPVLRAQLQKALDERRAAAYALYHEHQLRVAAENALADVRRECGAPFVTPALMDAFVGICALTDDVLRAQSENQKAC